VVAVCARCSTGGLTGTAVSSAWRPSLRQPDSSTLLVEPAGLLRVKRWAEQLPEWWVSDGCSYAHRRTIHALDGEIDSPPFKVEGVTRPLGESLDIDYRVLVEGSSCHWEFV
jgi:hypothetical protein